MPTLAEPTKEIRYMDLNEESKLPFDWTSKMTALGTTIAAAEFILSAGLAKYHEGFDTMHATVWLEFPGEISGPVTCTCRITTAEIIPQKFDRTVTIKLKPF